MSLFRARNLALLFGLIAAMILPAVARADDLDRFKVENELKAQKLVAEVKAALIQSRTLDPAEARDILRKVQARLEDDLVLPTRQRDSLLQQVRERLRMVIRSVRAQEAAEDPAAAKAAARIKEIQRRDDEAKGKRTGPTSVAKDYYNSAKGQFDALQSLKKRRELGVLGALGDVDVAAANMSEQRITQRFVRATEMRMKKLTPKERALLKALNSVLTVDFSNTRFNEVIEYLQEKTGQAIILDEGSLKEAMLDSDDPVTFKQRKLTVRTILKKILADRGLTYVIREGTIQVVTPQKARDMMVVRTYPVGDLVNLNPQMGFFGQLMALQNIQQLITTIQTTVEPAIWQQGATISYLPGAQSLVIRAPAEIHYSLGFGGK